MSLSTAHAEVLTPERVFASPDLSGPQARGVALGDRFVAGYVLYTGQQTLPSGEKIRAVPLDALWRLAP